ncbi:LysR family transcriptional regulator [Rhizobium sp. R86522]|uniref:LysR family transcriptional regulator n=1 Tax=Rhizobium sp. R86522 TaxID=3093861 RepID=UPI00366D37D1
MLPDLPSPLLRSFVAVADGGSLAAAATKVNRSESALSLQMQRLEDIVGQPLFDRDGRALKLNGTGSWLLAHSRAILARIDAARAELDAASRPPIRLGVVQDFVGQVLQPTLADLRGEDGETRFSIVIGSTSELLQAMGEDRIDTAVCAGDVAAGGAGGTVLPMGWFGDVRLLEDEVVPLVSITPPCPFLAAATRALDAVGRPRRLALVTPSLDGVRAAVAAGLGIACRTEAGMGQAALTGAGLPDLSDIRYAVIEKRPGKTGPSEAALRMAAHLSTLGQT